MSEYGGCPVIQVNFDQLTSAAIEQDTQCTGKVSLYVARSRNVYTASATELPDTV